MRHKIVQGDSLDIGRLLAKFQGKVQTCVTSPPYYGLRNYGVDGQLGLEETPEEYVDRLCRVFRGVRDLLRDDGTLWLNLGDSYSTKREWDTRRFKPKDLLGIPWRVAFALQADGWRLRQDIIWHKSNPIPESVRDRCTKAHEYIFLLAKSSNYFFDHQAMQEPAKHPEGPGNIVNHKHADAYAAGDEKMRTKLGLSKVGPRETRNKRSVWAVNTRPYKGAHFAVFPPDLIRPCILAGSKPGSIVLDPFTGSGTTGYVSLTEGRHFVGVELNPEYIKMADDRLAALPKSLW